MSKALEIANNETLFKALKALMWKAGDAILDVYQQDDFGTEVKGDDSPVTKADLAAHNVLLAGLADLTPDIPVVSEEDKDSLAIPKTNSVYWLIDPLDGTKEFIKRNGEFTCNLALIEHNKTTLGFVGVPANDKLYTGGGSITSQKSDRNNAPLTIKHVRTNPTLTRIVASKSHLNSETQAFIENIDGDVELVQAGSSLKFLKIATGDADLYPRLAPTCEWDTAAAQAVLEGAGGKVTQANGEPMIYGKDEILNPHFIASTL
jgi:3'(2'), 5'-bisphosphate nucleotidase